MFVLCYLDVGNGSALPGDLREAMGVSSARVAAALGALERKGLVARSTDQNDRRRVIVSITQAGRAQVHARQQLLRDNMKYMLRSWANGRKEYIRIVGRIIANIAVRGGSTARRIMRREHEKKMDRHCYGPDAALGADRRRRPAGNGARQAGEQQTRTRRDALLQNLEVRWRTGNYTILACAERSRAWTRWNAESV
jgi:DNA-binding MarR family transcriptional regulator